MAIIAHLSDKKLSYNSVEMTQKSCFPVVVAQPGFGPSISNVDHSEALPYVKFSE